MATVAAPRLGPPVPPSIQPEPEPQQPVSGFGASPQNAGIAGGKELLKRIATEIANLAPLVETIDPTLITHIGTMVNAGAALVQAFDRIESNQGGGGGAEPAFQPNPAEPAPSLG